MARLLIIDDEPDARWLMRMFFESQGFSCEEAPNGKVALQMIEEDRFHAMLLDCQMPVMDGLEFLDCLRARDPDTPPVVFMTGYVTDRLKKEAFERGAACVISKPFKLADILFIVSQLVGMRRAGRPIRRNLAAAVESGVAQRRH